MCSSYHLCCEPLYKGQGTHTYFKLGHKLIKFAIHRLFMSIHVGIPRVFGRKFRGYSKQFTQKMGGYSCLAKVFGTRVFFDIFS